MNSITKKTDGPQVFIILVNYNGFEDTIECVESLKKIRYSNYKIIIVDNGSTKVATKEQLNYLTKEAIYIQSKENLGFSGGNNIGIEYAKENGADYYLLLNNDTVVEPDFLNILITAAEENKDAGIIGGKILYFYEPNKIWFGGGIFDEKTGLTYHISQGELNGKQSSHKVKKITFMTGCLMLIPRSVVEKVGLLSEEYFLYSEDDDFCCRVMRAGYKILYCEDAVIYHKVSASSGQQSNAQVYYIVRNKLEIIRLYSECPMRAYIVHTYQYICAVLKHKLKFKPVIRGYFDFLLHKMGKLQGNI